MKTKMTGLFSGVLAAAVCLGCAAPARAFGGNALEQLGYDETVDYGIQTPEASGYAAAQAEPVEADAPKESLTGVEMAGLREAARRVYDQSKTPVGDGFKTIGTLKQHMMLVHAHNGDDGGFVLESVTLGVVSARDHVVSVINDEDLSPYLVSIGADGRIAGVSRMREGEPAVIPAGSPQAQKLIKEELAFWLRTNAPDQGSVQERAGDWWRRNTRGAPFTGRHRIIFYPESLVQAQGAKEFRLTVNRSRLSRDPDVLAKINRVAERLSAVADRPDFAWEVAVIDDPGTVNAMCLPGGKVLYYTGMLSLDADEPTLAATLAHEFAHAIARHSGEMMSEQIVLAGGGIAGLMIVPAAVPVLAPAIAANASLMQTISFANALVGFGGGMGLGALHFTRVMESEADYIGMILMAKAGYDPKAALDGMRRFLASRPDHKYSQVTKYLSAHPLTSQRIADMERWLPLVRGQYYRPAP